jgi:hypothetical protein
MTDPAQFLHSLLLHRIPRASAPGDLFDSIALASQVHVYCEGYNRDHMYEEIGYVFHSFQKIARPRNWILVMGCKGRLLPDVRTAEPDAGPHRTEVRGSFTPVIIRPRSRSPSGCKRRLRFGLTKPPRWPRHPWSLPIPRRRLRLRTGLSGSVVEI